VAAHLLGRADGRGGIVAAQVREAVLDLQVLAPTVAAAGSMTPSLMQPVPGFVQFLSLSIIVPPAPPADTEDFYIDNCLVKRDDRPRYSYN
jgi:hypothetical protein